jgi:hypothetical protein
MIDHETHCPIDVHVDGDAGPYLLVPVAQISDVEAVLRQAGIGFWTESNAIALNGVAAIAAINLGRNADVQNVRSVLAKAS